MYLSMICKQILWMVVWVSVESKSSVDGIGCLWASDSSIIWPVLKLLDDVFVML